MPNNLYASNAQRRWAHAAVRRGEVSKAYVKKHDAASAGKKLPTRVKPKK